MSLKNENGWVARLAMVLFSLPFVGFGCFMSFQALSTTVSYFDVQSWVETPAYIEAVNSGGVDIRYRYQYSSLEYTSTRLGVNDTKVNGDPGYDGKEKLLKKHAREGTVYRCYVDPDSPENSVVFRHFRWKQFLFMIPFSLVFLGVGLAVMYGALRSSSFKKSGVDEQVCERPWLEKSSWKDGVVKSSSKTAVVIMGIFTLVWNGITFSAMLDVEWVEKLERGQYEILIALLFPFIGIVMITIFAYMFFRYVKFGTSVLIIDHETGTVGGDLSGVIEINPILSMSDEVEVHLSCVKVSTTGSGDSRRTHKTPIWEDSYRVNPIISPVNGRKLAIVVWFDIPKSAREVSGDSSNGIQWVLTANAEVDGIDYRDSFDVSVFKSSVLLEPTGILDGVDVKSIKREYTDDEVVESYVEDNYRGEREYVFGMFRHPGTVFALALFTAIFGGASVFMIIDGGAPTIMQISFSCASALVAYSTINVMFYRTKLVLADGFFELRYGLFGLRKVCGDTSEIRDLKTQKGMQSGNTQFYTLKMIMSNGKKYTVACRLLNKEVESVKNSIVERL